ncbi:MAG: PEP-CTERM sorting domain-containing protein [Akkermansiaceae bacterium]|nr:PEP-CTERM sorting domain-containing protein [Akkermansiaceae bacterium]
MKIPPLVQFASVLWIGFFVSAQAIEIQGHSAAENDRFADDPSFIGAAYDWSGVGRATTGTAGKGGHWATMISSNVFLSANHYYPGTETSLYFYPDNDAGSSPVVRTITGGQRIGTSDLWIGTIDSALPNTISYYNWANQSLNVATYALSMVADENALTAGITSTATGYGADKRTSMAVGRNVIDQFLTLTVAGTTAPALRTLEEISGDTGLVSYESQLASGDSGGPLFIDDGGELLLVGINWAIGQVDIDLHPTREDLRDASYYSYVGNYATEIQNYVDAHAVPEPSPALSFLTGLGLLTARRRR